jgi:CubicO group peptidase (beta-lactamase class C family)
MTARAACALILTLCSWGTGAQELDATHKAALDSELSAIVNDAKLPLASLSALAIRDGKVVYQGQFGYRVLPLQAGDKGAAADARTLYRIASISKQVSTIGAMRLVEEGKLDLDADISGYLGFAVRNPDFPDSAITPRMLLSHTSSLRDDAGYSLPLDATLQSLLQPQGSRFDKGAWAARSELQDRTPGRFFYYANLNFGVLGTVIEAITKERFDQYMQRTVLKPLGVPGAYTPETLSQDDIDHVAVLYRKGQDGAWKSDGPWVPQTDDFQGKLPAPRAGLAAYVPGTNALGFGAQGGLRTSVEGLSRIMRMLMNGGELDGVRILKSSSVAAMQQMQWQYTAKPLNGDNFGGEFFEWGLGTQRFIDFTAGVGVGDRLISQGGLTGYGHIGLAYGLQSMFFYDAGKRIGLIYAIGGSGIDPALALGRYSANTAWEEKILDAMYRNAIQTAP